MNLSTSIGSFVLSGLTEENLNIIKLSFLNLLSINENIKKNNQLYHEDIDYIRNYILYNENLFKQSYDLIYYIEEIVFETSSYTSSPVKKLIKKEDNSKKNKKNIKTINENNNDYILSSLTTSSTLVSNNNKNDENDDEEVEDEDYENENDEDDDEIKKKEKLNYDIGYIGEILKGCFSELSLLYIFFLKSIGDNYLNKKDYIKALKLYNIIYYKIILNKDIIFSYIKNDYEDPFLLQKFFYEIYHNTSIILIELEFYSLSINYLHSALFIGHCYEKFVEWIQNKKKKENAENERNIDDDEREIRTKDYIEEIEEYEEDDDVELVFFGEIDYNNKFINSKNSGNNHVKINKIKNSYNKNKNNNEKKLIFKLFPYINKKYYNDNQPYCWYDVNKYYSNKNYYNILNDIIMVKKSEKRKEYEKEIFEYDNQRYYHNNVSSNSNSINRNNERSIVISSNNSVSSNYNQNYSNNIYQPFTLTSPSNYQNTLFYRNPASQINNIQQAQGGKSSILHEDENNETNNLEILEVIPISNCYYHIDETVEILIFLELKCKFI